MSTKEGGFGLEETIDLAGMLSFPASDPPAWSPTHAGTPSTAAVLRRAPEMLHEVVQRIRDDIRVLSDSLGERNDRSARSSASLARAAQFIEERLRDLGLAVKSRPPSSGMPGNIEAVIVGAEDAVESVVVGAHYDTAPESRGADDNASGVAGLLALAHALQETPLARTVRLVAFVHQAPSHTRTRTMGSVRYVDDLLREGPRVTTMISLEMIGICKRELSWPLCRLPPLRADVLALVGDLRARRVVKRAKRAFESAQCGIDVCALNLPLFLPGVRASDHWSFARRGIPAFMVTDTGPFRSRTDVSARLDFDRIGRASGAIAAMVRDLAGVARSTR